MPPPSHKNKTIPRQLCDGETTHLDFFKKKFESLLRSRAVLSNKNKMQATLKNKKEAFEKWNK